jgi:hypothetical protein
MRLRIWFRGSLMELVVADESTQATLVRGEEAVDVEIQGQRMVLEPGQTVTAKR